MAAIDLDAKLAEVEETYIEDRRSLYRSYVQEIGSRCESPIERIFAAAMVAELLMSQEFNWDILSEQKEEYQQAGSGTFSAQFKVGSYRVDFLLVLYEFTTKPIRIVVECDGHDFHERTKEQAIYDRQKDRWLQSHGFIVLRFTGSEIWRDPVDCASQVMRTLWNRIMS